jgi:hypothetical protein
MKRRRVLVYVALYVREHGCPPSWSEIRAAVGLSRFRLVALMASMRADGFITYDDDVPGDLRVTAAGLVYAGGRRS